MVMIEGGKEQKWDPQGKQNVDKKKYKLTITINTNGFKSLI